MVKTYTKSENYTLPMGSSHIEFIDGLYVDSVFFDNNIPIAGAILDVSITRSGNLLPGLLSLFIVTFSSGAVGQDIIGGGMWNTGDTGPFIFNNNLFGKFYGMGLNSLDIRMGTQYPVSAMTFNVKYVLEVHD